MSKFCALRRHLLVVFVALAVAGCIYQREPVEPDPLDEPIDAFEAVGDVPESNADAARRGDESLSEDIDRLKRARQTYREEQERRSAQTARSQAACRERGDSREVAIEDGSGDRAATYCQPAAEN